MSTRSHFWFRIAAISAIMLAQFGPRLWNGSPVVASGSARVMAASVP